MEIRLTDLSKSVPPAPSVPTALIRDHKSVLHYITDVQMKHAKCQLTSQAVDLKSYSLQFSLDKRLLKTSLKIFKHYKLKPSFSIIKDNKAKDKVGVGDKPPPPKFQQFDQL